MPLYNPPAAGGGGGGAPTDATYITKTSNATLTNEQALSGLSTGVVKVTTGTGALSTAVAGTDYADVSHTHTLADITDEGALAAKNTIATGDIDADAVTYAKIQNVSATDKVLGRSTAGAGDIEEIACTAAGRALLDDAAASDQRTTLGLGSVATQGDGDKGDITVSATGATWTVDNDAISYAKIQNVSATDKLLGRSTAGAGDVEEITCTAAGRAILDDADAAAQRTTLALGNVDNTSDASKPVSTAQQTALDLKANLASPTFTGTPSLPTGTTGTTQSAGDSSTKLATTAFVTTADNLKANLASPTFTGTVTVPGLTINDATDLTISATTGTKIGQGTSKVGFFGVTPVVRPTALTQTYSTASATHAAVTQLAAPAGGTGAAAGAWSTAANRDLAITSINAARTDIANLKNFVNQIVDQLQALGLLQ